MRRVSSASFLITAGSACGERVSTHLERGDAALKKAAYEDAVREYQHAEQLEPGNAHAVRQLGFAYRAVGDRARAIHYLERWRRVSVLDSAARVTLGELYVETGWAVHMTNHH